MHARPAPQGLGEPQGPAPTTSRAGSTRPNRAVMVL